MSAYEIRASTGRQLGCADLPCVDIGVGIHHHPWCGYTWDDDEFFGPLSPEDEEELPPDPAGEE